MNFRLPVYIISLFFLFTSSYAQTEESNRNLPLLGINTGPVFFMGDVNTKDVHQSFLQRAGNNIYMEERLGRPFSISLNFFINTIFGDEMIGQNNLNFKTSIFSQSLRFHYNFYPFIKPENQKRKIVPFISAGVESIVFKPKGDLKDKNGNYYIYDSITGKILNRDYVYETDLREANLDNMSQLYPLVSFSIPASVGVTVQIVGGLNARLAADYHYTFTDMLDNISSSGTGYRKGNSNPDNLLFVSLGLNYDFNYIRKSSKSPDKEIISPIVKTDTTKLKILKTPLEFRYADLNKDDKISLDEVEKMIDLFLEGDKNRTLENLQKLMEYFFDN